MIEFKTWPKYYRAIVSREKAFEFRLDDKGARVGDTILLREWDNSFKCRGYTGNSIKKKITFRVVLDDFDSEGFILGFEGAGA